jgi:hypothetical protein
MKRSAIRESRQRIGWPRISLHPGYAVIASEAKQSILPRGEMDCFVAFAPRNDGG